MIFRKIIINKLRYDPHKSVHPIWKLSAIYFMKKICCVLFVGFFLANCSPKEKKNNSRLQDDIKGMPREDQVTINGDTIKANESYFAPENIYVTDPEKVKRAPRPAIVIKKDQ